MTTRLLIVLLLSAQTAAAAATKLSDGSVVHTSHGAGCAAVRRVSSEGALIWYFSLRSDAPLTVRESDGAVSIASRAGVVARDDVFVGKPADRATGRPSMLRVHRPDGPCVSNDAATAIEGFTADGPVVLKKNAWIYAAAGDVKAPQLVVRLAHEELMEGGKPRVVRTGNTVHAQAFGAEAFDDGTFASGTVQPEWLVEEHLGRARLRRTFGNNREAPELDVARWLQTPTPLPLASQRMEKIVLLDFWGVWCQPCIEQLPELAALRKKVPSEQFLIIGVHSAAGAENLDAFLAGRGYPVLVAVDTGETAKRYAVTQWPTYVLIDKLGRVASYGNELPSAETIAALLR